MAQVIWADAAIDQLREIVGYIANTSPDNAEKVRIRLVRAPRVLESLPEFGQCVPEFNQHHIRELLVKPFRMLYLIRGDACHIVYIVRASRNLKGLLSAEDLEGMT